MAIKLIIGLRNPGSAYAHTRHNAGAWFVEAFAKRSAAHFKTEKKLHAELAAIDINPTICRLALPLTYMNHSGLSAREISQFFRILPSEILVVHDELDLPAGRVKLKSGGGNGGHNGLRDISAQLHNTDYHRLRIGIGHPGHKDLVHNYVLGKPSADDRQLIFDAIERAVAIMPAVMHGNIAGAMNELNG